MVPVQQQQESLPVPGQAWQWLTALEANIKGTRRSLTTQERRVARLHSPEYTTASVRRNIMRPLLRRPLKLLAQVRPHHHLYRKGGLPIWIRTPVNTITFIFPHSRHSGNFPKARRP